MQLCNCKTLVYGACLTCMSILWPWCLWGRGAKCRHCRHSILQLKNGFHHKVCGEMFKCQLFYSSAPLTCSIIFLAILWQRTCYNCLAGCQVISVEHVLHAAKAAYAEPMFLTLTYREEKKVTETYSSIEKIVNDAPKEQFRDGRTSPKCFACEGTCFAMKFRCLSTCNFSLSGH